MGTKFFAVIGIIIFFAGCTSLTENQQMDALKTVESTVTTLAGETTTTTTLVLQTTTTMHQCTGNCSSCPNRGSATCGCANKQLTPTTIQGCTGDCTTCPKKIIGECGKTTFG